MTNRELFEMALDAMDSDNPNIQLRTAMALRGRVEQLKPLRPWVGLTNQERNHIWRDFIGWGDPSHDDENLMKAIEDKIKEKNDC
jgi:hypothetical protein